MNQLKTTRALVKRIMENDPQTRNSDSYLYLKVIEHIAAEKNISLANISVVKYLLHMKDLGFPPFESVRRSRQKIQEHHPELAACSKVEEKRMENEKEYRAFAVGGACDG